MGRHIKAVSMRFQFSAKKEICHMPKTAITHLPDPSIADRRLRSNQPSRGLHPGPLTELVRDGADICPSARCRPGSTRCRRRFSGCEIATQGRTRLLFRGSTESWRELLLDRRRRGLKQDPKPALGPSRGVQANNCRAVDGALGFRAVMREVFATTWEQSCRVHKAMNALKPRKKTVKYS